MLVELSWCVVRIKDDASKMTIISPSAEENGVFYPSQDINIYGQKDIKEGNYPICIRCGFCEYSVTSGIKF